MRFQHDLELAREVQQALSPRQLPELRGARLAAANQAARIVNGDLYDVVVLDPDRVAILLADVSGKGFPAALLASQLQATVRAVLRAACVFADTSLGLLPVQVVALVNDEMSRRDQGPYATLFFAEFDARERTFRYVNAGHNPPLLILPNGGRGSSNSATAARRPACSATPRTITVSRCSAPSPRCSSTPMASSSRATPGTREFGVERLTALCRAHSREDPDGLITTVLDEVRDLEHWPGAARRCHSVRPEDYYLRAAASTVLPEGRPTQASQLLPALRGRPTGPSPARSVGSLLHARSATLQALHSWQPQHPVAK